MTSIKAAAAIAVVAVIVIAVGAFAVLNNGGGGNGSDSTVDAIGTNVKVGDMYTLSTSTSGSTLGADLSTTYEVTGVYGDDLSVDVTTGSNTNPTNMTKDEFLDNVSVTAGSLVGEVVGQENLSTSMGTVACTIYRNAVDANEISIEILEWISTGSNIIYKTQMKTIYAGITDVETISLVDTNMIGESKPGDIVVPDTPVASDDVRTDLQPGDFIEFTKHDDGRPEVERYTVVSVDDRTVTYRESGDDDLERASIDSFLGIIIYNGDSVPMTTETISTVYGEISCNVYEYQFFGGILDFDWEDKVVVWASVDNNVIYKIESTEDYYDHDDRWDHWYDDVESYYLTDTSLFSSSPGGGSDPTPTPTPSQNRFGIDVAIGDGYTIRADDGETKTYEVIDIQGSRLFVKETETEFGHTEVDFDYESANEFLSRIMITHEQLDSQRYENAGSGSVGDRTCTIYVEKNDDDRDAIWVAQSGSNYIIWQEGSYWNGQAYDCETLVEFHIAAN